MSWLRILSLSLALSCVSCGPLSPTDLPAAYEEVIQSEWRIAQRLLQDIDVERTDLVVPQICTWIPHDGMFKTSASWTGHANGEFDSNGYIIKWNVQTPQVIRHEAGHAILHFLDHPCWRCFSVDGNKVTLHGGPRCEGTKIGCYCQERLEEAYGKVEG